MSRTPQAPSGLGSVPPSQTPYSYGASGSFRQWELAVAICEDTDWLVPENHQNDFRRLLECKVPKKLGKLTHQSVLSIEAEMLSEARRLPSQVLSDDDPHEVCLVWPYLCFILQTLEKTRKTQTAMNEASKGLIPTLLLQVVFGRHGDRRQVREQESLRLPRPRADMVHTLASVPRPSPTADLLITSLEASVPSDIRYDPFYEQLVWQDIPPTSNTSVIIFAAEYKTSINEQSATQLLMYLATAQHQRRALGLEDSIIYGATYTTPDFCLYASYWKNEEMHWNLVRAFDLRHLKDLIDCYTCLCQIADDAKRVEGLLKNLSADGLKDSDHQSKNKWRADSAPGKGEGPSDRKDRERSSNSRFRRTEEVENVDDSGDPNSAPHTDDDSLPLIAFGPGDLPKDESIKAWLSTLDTSGVP